MTLWRGFTHDLNGGGRWYASGGSYQNMKGADRLASLRIGGAAVVEVDARASFLAILHGLTQTQLPEGDPYGVVPGLSRETVKAWVSQTVGDGRLPSRWSARAVEEVASGGVNLKVLKVVEVNRAVVARFPFLENLPALLGCEEEPRLCSLRLQRIEAAALTTAMRALRQQHIPSLPMHDALLVAAPNAEAAQTAMQRGYSEAAGTVPEFRIKGGEQIGP